ncbi:MAG: stage V sporulation protein AD [Firmicutes bacterium]|nr:stage V sporulation protein AD [Bacillota bacterium]
MSVKQCGAATYAVSGVYIQSTASVVGPKEGHGPFRGQFDRVWEDEGSHAASFEKAEQQLLAEAYAIALQKGGLRWEDIQLVIGGDLLDQVITTNFVARSHGRPLAGIFAACATFTEGLGLGALLVGGADVGTVMVSAVSHHATAERQFRFPLELGYQRTPTSAWTATAAGAVVLSQAAAPLAVESVTFGRVVDLGGKDPNDMGSAMAPAAYDTIMQHLKDMGQELRDFDAIYTGDLGHFGLTMLKAYGERQGTPFGAELHDCGRELYDRDRQDTHNGGSGPGCSASVFSGPLTRKLMAGEWHRLLLVATGALYSPTTYQQGETIPCIAHAIQISRGRAHA